MCDGKQKGSLLSGPALFHTMQHGKQHRGEGFAVLLTEVLVSHYQPDQILLQILLWQEMHRDPSRNLAHNRATENFSFMRFGCCDSATSLCGRNSLARTNFSNILKFAEICIMLEVIISKGNTSRRNVKIASRMMGSRQMLWNCRITKNIICSQVKWK